MEAAMCDYEEHNARCVSTNDLMYDYDGCEARVRTRSVSTKNTMREMKNTRYAYEACEV